MIQVQMALVTNDRCLLILSILFSIIIFRHNVVPVGGPEEKLAEKIQPVRLNVFDTKAANAVLIDAEMQIKSGYPTIAASSMVSRRRRSETHDETDSNPDVKFFSELVKPIQYRWKFQRDKNRIIMPSKHGYHPRSKSPTFQRLVEATEKLQVIIEHDSGMGSFERDDELETRSQFSPGEPVLSLGAIEREIKSEPPSVTHSVYSIPPVKSTEPQSHERPIPKYKLQPDSPPKEIPKEEFKDSENEVIDEISDDEDEVFIEPEPHVNSSMQQTEFKVDFKKMDTHSELHLFLPLINSGHDVNESRAKPKSKRRVNKVALPSIDDVSQSKSEEKVTKKDRKSGEHRRKKKRAIPRIKSGHEDIEVKDILNDVTTLISMKKEQMLDYHTASMCMFENCDYHPRHNKSTKIRQA